MDDLMRQAETGEENFTVDLAAETASTSDGFYNLTLTRCDEMRCWRGWTISGAVSNN